MTRLVFSPRALQDAERLTDCLLKSDPAAASDTTHLMLDGLRILKQHPLIGRPAERGYRELLISRGRTGYVALYQYHVEKETVLIFVIRHQRQGGFPE